MQVLKFGGSSVATAKAMEQTASIIRNAATQQPTVVVVSALGGTTDALLQCGQQAAAGDEAYLSQLEHLKQRHLDTAKALLPLTNQSSLLSLIMQQFNELGDILNGVYLLHEISPRTNDRVVSYGELLSSRILSAALQANGAENLWVDARKLIRTDAAYTKAAVDNFVTQQQVRDFFAQTSQSIYVVPGFIASDTQGHTTTLGRGGSDYTAAIFGAALPATEVQIWTDVSGMMTADPRLVPHARVSPHLSYQEAMELSHFGAKVIYPPTLQPVMSLGIPVIIKNTFQPEDPGTRIEAEVKAEGTIRGISSINHLALLSLEGSGMVGIPGFSKRLFEALAAQSLNVILITQASSEHSICVGVEENAAAQAKDAVDRAFDVEIARGLLNPLVVETGLAIVALVGDNMKNHTGTSGKMFGALGRNGVNIRAIAQGSSERNISAVIATRDVKKAINVLHEEFFETTFKQVNLFIAGTGNVGKKLLDQLQQQREFLQQHLRLHINVIGLANSRKMLLREEGFDAAKAVEALEMDGTTMDLQKFVDQVIGKNLRNSVFVDITASAAVAEQYAALFEKSISVVACNKIACSSAYDNYRRLKELSRDHNASFLFETNVGAGLPVIGTLKDLLHSGDRVNEIQAVLSGTLNFVFNNYDGSRPFAEVVRQAQEEGYTEPDPRLDLSGVDVMRKIMILAREAGAEIKMEDVANESFMPASCMEGSVDDFYREMEKHEKHFRQLYDEAAANGNKLKFVASFKNGKATVGLKQVEPQHDFYHLYGKDNIVLFYTDRYVDQPMVVKGAGAGAAVTASGVFADIIRTASL
ncbi:MAG: bifunctional aspartate kinase/homoserine dehydrogenase I [Flavisolibacter sp.]